MFSHRLETWIASLLAGLLIASSAWAGSFTDNFDSGASSLWENNVGNWSASSGVYSAGTISNFPSAASALPWVLDDFTLEFDINDVQDGGVWLRSSVSAGSIGRVGVLLVTGAGAGALYWHVVTDGSNYGSSLNPVGGLFTPGASDAHFRIEVSGSTYSVYLDGATVAAATLIDGSFASGKVALYDFSDQTFDNVILTGAGVMPVPEPGTWAMLLAGLLAVGEVVRRRNARLQRKHT